MELAEIFENLWILFSKYPIRSNFIEFMEYFDKFLEKFLERLGINDSTSAHEINKIKNLLNRKYGEHIAKENVILKNLKKKSIIEYIIDHRKKKEFTVLDIHNEIKDEFNLDISINNIHNYIRKKNGRNNRYFEKIKKDSFAPIYYKKRI